MADVELIVNGTSYGGWVSAKWTRSMESIAGSFELEITDRWAGTSQPWPIFEEDECTLKVLGQVVLTGYVDKRKLGYKKDGRTFSVSGRDRSAALVDCSAILDRQVFRQTPVLDLIKKICEPFKIKVTMQAGLAIALPPRDKLAINPGDTAHHALERVCRMIGALMVSDGKGGLLLTRAGTDRCTTSLEEGVNILEASADYDFTQRFYKVVVLSQNAKKIGKKTTKASAKAEAKSAAAAARARAEAFDGEVSRKERVLLINPEDGADKPYADRRAQWEVAVRAAKSESVTVTVQGWAQESGTLWPINTIVPIVSDDIGVFGDMLIVEAKGSVSNTAGRLTELTLKRPDAYLPQPRIQKKAGKAPARWKELQGGVPPKGKK